jgi:hypothetical protein
MLTVVMGLLVLVRTVVSGLERPLKNAGVKHSHAEMKPVLTLIAITGLSACSMSKNYGDFYGGKTWYGAKDTIAVSSPAINMQSLSRGSKEFLLTGAPISIDPLKFSVGRAGRGGSGKINVEILTYPERRFAGNVIVAEDGKPIRTVVKGYAAALDSWVVRVTEISPIAPETHFKIHYYFKK